jgi:hypothetical protein
MSTLYKNKEVSMFFQLFNLFFVKFSNPFQNIHQAAIRRCIGSMIRRCQACVNSRGGHTAFSECSAILASDDCANRSMSEVD